MTRTAGRPGRARGRDGPAPRRTVKPHRRRLRRLLTHRSVQAILIVLVLFLGWVGWSVGQAMTAPGNGTASTRLAEWAWDHYLGPVVTLGEWLTYKAPKVGGKPQFRWRPRPPAAPRRGPLRTSPVPPRSRRSCPPGSAHPPDRRCPVKDSGGSGRVRGVPAIYGTYLRPDSVHTSYVAGIASMDQRLLTFQLGPGVEDPGPGNWASPRMAPGTGTGLEATFNGGFKIASAGGGFYLNGLTSGTLTSGAASLVYYQNGELAIGFWDHCVGMTPDVLGVRQNLKPIVDHGTVPASVGQDVLTQWGATLGGGYYVWRSGVGITSDGRIIFVYGPALSVRSLAGLLSGRRRERHAVGHQPGLDVLHVLQAVTECRRPRTGEPSPAPAGTGGPLLLSQQPRLHGGIRPVIGPLPEAVASRAAASDAAPYPARGLLAVLRTARPRQWPKNLLVFAAPLAGMSLGRPDGLAYALVAAVAFTVASVAVYMVNDVADADRDRRHPVKRRRPIAARELPKAHAVAVAVGCVVVALAAGFLIRTPLLSVIIAAYIASSLFTASCSSTSR